LIELGLHGEKTQGLQTSLGFFDLAIAAPSMGLSRRTCSRTSAGVAFSSDEIFFVALDALLRHP